jgi:putative Holliday junction resolvase
MGRILAIDYGLKRVGLAVTDPLQMIASPLTTVPATSVLDFVMSYIQQEAITLCVIGFPADLKHKEAPIITAIKQFMATLKEKIPHLEIVPQDERYTSQLAVASLVEGGFKKKDRRKKGNIDKISATIILQSFLRVNTHNSHQV